VVRSYAEAMEWLGWTQPPSKDIADQNVASPRRA
jgi:hypothetical protein